jgi:AmmeMemoRadiSam system protein B/AmmeMemoRadiSam system protein A
MRTIFVIAFSIFSMMKTFPQDKTIDREPVAAGRFYTADKDTLTKEVISLFENCKKSPGSWHVRAIISPHAGYVFSGKIAAEAYSAINRSVEYKNIFIIGSSHVMSFDGASVYNTGDYITPLGKISVNREIANKLILGNKVFNFPTKAHLQEHSIEVQLPFIQYYFRNKPKIVPIIIGTHNEMTVKQISEALRPWFTADNLFVISSDFAHYPPYSEAVESDKSTALSIISGDTRTFLKTLKLSPEDQISGLVTRMCGWTSGLMLMYLAENNTRFEYKLIDYCNSGDSPYGGKAEVVGYNAIALIERNLNSATKPVEKEVISFTDKEKNYLFSIVRNSIKSGLEHKHFEFDEKKIPSKFMLPMGAFVTLKINGALRGCIGRFVSSDPLYEAVHESAISSAFGDPRFSPLTGEEYPNTTIEITVLGPLIKINGINEIVLGRHGIYIKKDSRSGTMLPQVATENGWTVEEFLGYTSRDKAGLGWDGWKNAELFIYEGVVLDE